MCFELSSFKRVESSDLDDEVVVLRMEFRDKVRSSSLVLECSPTHQRGRPKTYG